MISFWKYLHILILTGSILTNVCDKLSAESYSLCIGSVIHICANKTEIKKLECPRYTVCLNNKCEFKDDNFLDKRDDTNSLSQMRRSTMFPLSEYKHHYEKRIQNTILNSRLSYDLMFPVIILNETEFTVGNDNLFINATMFNDIDYKTANKFMYNSSLILIKSNERNDFIAKQVNKFQYYYTNDSYKVKVNDFEINDIILTGNIENTVDILFPAPRTNKDANNNTKSSSLSKRYEYNDEIYGKNWNYYEREMIPIWSNIDSSSTNKQMNDYILEENLFLGEESSIYCVDCYAYVSIRLYGYMYWGAAGIYCASIGGSIEATANINLLMSIMRNYSISKRYNLYSKTIPLISVTIGSISIETFMDLNTILDIELSGPIKYKVSGSYKNKYGKYKTIYGSSSTCDNAISYMIGTTGSDASVKQTFSNQVKNVDAGVKVGLSFGLSPVLTYGTDQYQKGLLVVGGFLNVESKNKLLCPNPSSNFEVYLTGKYYAAIDSNKELYLDNMIQIGNKYSIMNKTLSWECGENMKSILSYPKSAALPPLITISGEDINKQGVMIFESTDYSSITKTIFNGTSIFIGYTVKKIHQINEKTNSVTNTFSHGCKVLVSMIIKDIYLYSGCHNGLIKQWDTKTGNYIRSFTGHTNTITAMVVVDNYLYSGSDDSYIKKWSLSNGNLVKDFIMSNRIVSMIDLKTYYENYIYINIEGQLKLLSLSTDIIITVKSYSDFGYSCNMVLNGDMLYFTSGKNTIDELNINTYESRTFRDDISITELIVHKNFLYSFSKNDYIMKQWSLSTGSNTKKYNMTSLYPDGVTIHNDKLCIINMYRLKEFSPDISPNIQVVAETITVSTLTKTDTITSISTLSCSPTSTVTNDITKTITNSVTTTKITSGDQNSYYMLSGTVSGASEFSHSSSITKDGDYIYVSSYATSNVARLNTITNDIIYFKGHTNTVKYVLVHNGLLYTGSMDKTIKVWDAAKRTLIRTLSGHTDTIMNIIIYGDYIYSGSYDGSIIKWAISDGKFVNKYNQGSSIYTLTINDGIIYSGSSNGYVYKLVISTNTFSVYLSYSYGVYSLATDGYRIFLGTSNGIYEHYLSNSAYSYKYEHSITNDDLILVNNGYIYSITKNNNVKQWNIKTGSNTMTYYTKAASSGFGICIHNGYLYTGSENGLKRWVIISDPPLSATITQTSTVTSSITTTKVNTITQTPVTVTSTSTLSQITVTSTPVAQCVNNINKFGTNTKNYTLNGSGINSLIIDNLTYLYTAHSDGMIRKWDVEKGINSYNYSFSNVITYALDIENESMYASYSDNVVRRWNISTGLNIKTYTGHSDSVTSLLVDKGYIYSGSKDFTIKQWSISTGNLIRTFNKHTGSVYSLYVDNDILYSGSSDKTIRKWNITSGSYIKGFTGHNNVVNTLSIFNGNLYSGSYDKVIKEWNISTGLNTRNLTGHSSYVLSLFSTNGSLYSSSDDKTIKQWNLTTGANVYNFTGHSAAVNSVYVYNNLLYSGSSNGEIKQIHIKSKTTGGSR
ncbi:hypothetical protein HDU92_008461 [Lobulomyces angularis]|nr:hypothetical protein HDU92_008461 [Lobulomyces angularis]